MIALLLLLHILLQLRAFEGELGTVHGKTAVRCQLHHLSSLAFTHQIHAAVTLSLEVLELGNELLVLMLQVLDDTLLLGVFLHQLARLLLKLLIDGQILFAVGQSFVLLIL